MQQAIRKQLCLMSETKYQKFSSALIPGVDNILGIRLPELRKLAKQLAKSDWKAVVREEDIYFEERMLRGMILNYVKGEYEEILPYITAFIPLVDNWSVCDSVFMGMTILQKDRERTWDYIQPYLQSGKEFEVRVALIIMMQHLLKCDAKGKKLTRLRMVDMQAVGNDMEEPGLFINRILEVINREFDEGYYASMAAAWLLAECFCVYPYHTMEFMKNNKLDKVTFNKGIQKIIESRIPTDEVKQTLRCMKR